MLTWGVRPIKTELDKWNLDPPIGAGDWMKGITAGLDGGVANGCQISAYDTPTGSLVYTQEWLVVGSVELQDEKGEWHPCIRAKLVRLSGKEGVSDVDPDEIKWR